MHVSLKTDRERYYLLMALTCEKLPTSAVDTLVRTGHPANSIQLTAVRVGRSANNLPWLIDLVRVGMPEFDIPEDVMPAEQPADY